MLSLIQAPAQFSARGLSTYSHSRYVAYKKGAGALAVDSLRESSGLSSLREGRKSQYQRHRLHRTAGAARADRGTIETGPSEKQSDLPLATPPPQSTEILASADEKIQSETSSLRGALGKTGPGSGFGVPLTPDTFAITLVYFVQGIIGISRLAVTYFLKEDLALPPGEVAVLTGLSTLPWMIKPLYGFISDGLPLFGYRRRSYLVLSGIVGALSWGFIALFASDKYGLVGGILMASMSVAFADVVVDSMVVQRARGEPQSLSGSYQSLCWGSSAFGGLFTSYFSGSLVQDFGPRTVFGVAAALPLLTSVAAFFVEEERVSSVSPSSANNHAAHPRLHQPQAQELNGREAEGIDKADRSGSASHTRMMASVSTTGNNAEANGAPSPPPSIIEVTREQMAFIWEALRTPEVLLPTIFIFVWQVSPHSDTAMFFFNTNVLGFGPEFLGRVAFVTSAARLTGIGIYNTFLKEIPLRRLLMGSTLLGTTLGLTQLLVVTRVNLSLGISDEWFTLGDSLILTVLGQISFMPILVLATRICPVGVEATLYATLMSISNAAYSFAHISGGWLSDAAGISSTNFDNLVPLIIFCNFSSLIALPLLKWLPSDDSEPPHREEPSPVIVGQGSPPSKKNKDA